MRKNEMNQVRSGLKTTQYLTRVGILSAIAFVVMLFEFPIFPAAPYLKIDFSDAIALIGGVALGPLTAVIIEFIKNVLNLMLHSTTPGVGELANFLVGVGFVVPIALVYRKFTNNVGLIIGMILGALSMTIVACLSNYFILLPMYFGDLSPQDKIVILKFPIIPFNLIKAGMESVAAFIIFNSAKGLLKYVKIKQN